MGEAMTDALGILASYVIESGELDAAGGDALQGMELQRQGLREEAIEAYQRAASKLRHPALKLNLGVLLVLADHPDEAVKHLGEALSQPQLEAGAYHALGQANFKLNQHKKAARFLIQALQAADTALAMTPEEVTELGSVYDRLLMTLDGRNDEVLSAVNRRFMRMLEGKDWKQRIAETRRQLEETMRDQGDEGVVDMVADSRGDDLGDSVGLIDRYIRQGLLTLAMDEAHRAVEFSPHYLPVHLRMAEIMIREGRVRNAIGKYNMVAKTYLVRGENDRAASILSEVLEMAPLDISVRQSLIELLEAEERWNDVIDQYIDLADTYHQLGNFDLSRETFNLAERTANRVNSPVEKIVRIKHRMADIDQVRLDMRRAQKGYEEIVQLNPDDERAHRMLVDLNYRSANQIEAIRRLDQLLSIYARKKEINKITQLLEELVTLYPNDTGLRSRLGSIYVQLKRKSEAIVQFDALGELQLEAGLHKDAANTIRKIIGLNPDGLDDYRRLLAQLGG
jgi:tetratricopeptide (TPR) repeat protein